MDQAEADEDLVNMVAPPECNISDERAKTTMANFRTSCLTSARQCAVTGMGRSWCNSPTIGPALQACHIVSPLDYHTYPDPEADADETHDGGEMASPRRLEQAWERTWGPENGVLLFSHLHDMFDQRLFSIHPDTLQIRVFMPYDILLAYHGRRAKVQRRVDRAVLRHHYDMCCIENMTARMPFVEQLPRTGSVASTSGINTLLDIRPTLAGIAIRRIMESPSEQNQGEDGQRPDGDPSKRARHPERQHMPDLTRDCTDLSVSPSDRPMDDSTASPNLSCPRKRKREHVASCLTVVGFGCRIRRTGPSGAPTQANAYRPSKAIATRSRRLPSHTTRRL